MERTTSIGLFELIFGDWLAFLHFHSDDGEIFPLNFLVIVCRDQTFILWDYSRFFLRYLSKLQFHALLLDLDLFFSSIAATIRLIYPLTRNTGQQLGDDLSILLNYDLECFAGAHSIGSKLNPLLMFKVENFITSDSLFNHAAEKLLNSCQSFPFNLIFSSFLV